MALTISGVNTEYWVDASCRGMLASTSVANAGGVHGSGGVGGGGEPLPRRASTGGHDHAGNADEAGTSRHRGSEAGRHGEEGSFSGAE